MTAILYCFGESGNAYKAALTMQLSGFAWTPRYVDFFGGAARSPEFRAINPMGEVPVLVDGDLTLSQSGAIQIHVAETAGRLLGADRHERLEVLRWLMWDNHKLSGQAGMLRFLMNFLPADKRPAPVITFLQGQLKRVYDTLNTHLDGREWMVGTAPSLADCACAGYLYYPEPFGFDRAAWPHVDAWLARLAEQPGWAHPYDLMPGSPADRAAQ